MCPLVAGNPNASMDGSIGGVVVRVVQAATQAPRSMVSVIRLAPARVTKAALESNGKRVYFSIPLNTKEGAPYAPEDSDLKT